MLLYNRSQHARGGGQSITSRIYVYMGNAYKDTNNNNNGTAVAQRLYYIILE